MLSPYADGCARKTAAYRRDGAAAAAAAAGGLSSAAKTNIEAKCIV